MKDSKEIDIWVVIKIDHYGGELDCWCTFRNFDGVEAFTSEKLAEEEAAKTEGMAFMSSVIEHRTIKLI
jgi:hypothetical protein